MPRIACWDEQQIWKFEGEISEFAESGNPDLMIDGRSLQRAGGLADDVWRATVHTVELIFVTIVPEKMAWGLD
jgi:hypothetical protein